MTGNFWLDWAALAVSLHNTILLLWLGLTVLLNAEKRTWGIWFTGGALLLASAFFVSHSAILGHELDLTSAGLDFWWHVGWIPVIILPFGWYTITLWYSGFFASPASDLQNRQRLWFALASFLTLMLAALLAFANPLPTIAQIAYLQLASTDLILFPLYITDVLLCVILSLDALRHPAPSPRVMGDLARQRARPWFVATAIVLLMVGVLVGAFTIWITTITSRAAIVDAAMILAIGVFDLVVAILIAIAIFCVGQAVALYEVFTGKTLPRRGLLRHWHNAVILAIGYGVVMGWALAAQLRPIYSLLLTTALLTIFYALLGWRTYVERDSFVRSLRPFVTSQRLYDQLLTASPSDVDVTVPFYALCRDVLNVQTAVLTAVGPLAPLVPALAYPSKIETPPHIDLAQFDSPQTACLQIDTTHWAIPLWSERGLIGVLLLGEKIDGGIYSQEEIEIARASGERLIDTFASAELAQRVMALQRRQLTTSQLLDRQARRVLHDEVLPQLHAAMLMLNNANPQVIESLSNIHHQISDLLRNMPASGTPQIARLGLIGALQRLVDDEWRESFDHVTWDIEPAGEQAVREIPTHAAETLFYATREVIRNAARHGRAEEPQRVLDLRIAVKPGLQIIIEDNGVGIHSQPSRQASGQGLALHSAMLAIIGGTFVIESRASGGTRAIISLAQK